MSLRFVCVNLNHSVITNNPPKCRESEEIYYDNTNDEIITENIFSL